MQGIRLDRVSKVFGNVKAVDEIDLDVADGEFVSILGPSGCGKTTLLRMLAGLEQPTSGRISIGGTVVNELPPSRRNIAMVFQTYALYPHMTVAANIEYPLKKRGLAKAERIERVQQAATVLQLESLMNRKPRELSGGQQQRVALGRALVRNPAAFLLDEPLSNLDAKLRSHMRAELIQLHRRVRRTMVYVTHDQLEAMTMSDRIAVMNGGRLQQFGTPEDVYRRPANEFVAGFIGSPAMNFLDGTLSTRNGETKFRSSDDRLQLTGLRLQSTADNGGAKFPVRIGFRPEDIDFGEGAEAQVVIVEPTGHEVIVVFNYLGNEIVARVSPDQPVRVDDTVRLSPRISKLHVFSSADGRRLNDDCPDDRPAED